MVLVISPAEHYQNKLDVEEIRSQLFQLDLAFLEQIEKILFFQVRSKFKKSDFSKVVAGQKPKYHKRLMGYLDFSDQPESNKKLTIIFQLLKNIRIENTYAYIRSNSIRLLQKKEVVFFYPLFHSSLIDLLELLPSYKCFINLSQSGSKKRKEIIEVEYLHDFLDIMKVNDEIWGKFIPGLGEKITLNKHNHPPGGCLTELLPRDNVGEWRNSNFYFIGNYEHYFKYIFEYLRAISSDLLDLNESIYYHDCAEGIPEDFDSNYVFFIFINIDCLSFHEQSELFRLLNNYWIWDKKFCFHATTDKLIPIFEGYLTTFKVPPVENHKNILEEYFFKMLHRDVIFPTIEIPIAVEEWQVFLPFLLKVKDITYISKFVDTLNMNNTNFLRAEFWYNFILEINSDEMATTPKVKAQKKKPKQYYMRYRGDYWMLSFGYDLPMIVKDSIGLNYMAALMMNPGKKYSCYHLRRVLNRTKKSDDTKSPLHVKKIREPIEEAIHKIAKLEKDLKLKNDFPNYLIKLFTLSKHKGKSDVPIKDRCFSDINCTCQCELPDFPEIQWTIKTPYDFSKEEEE